MVYLYYGLIMIALVTTLQTRKKTSFVLFILLSVVFYIFAFSQNISDQSSYAMFYVKNSFDNLVYINYNESSVLFSILAALVKAIGLDYIGFKIVLFVLSSLACILSYRRHTTLGMLLVAFSTLPLFFDMIQIRFFCAEVILIVALSALANGKKLVYALLVLLASLFHSMIIVLLLFVFLPSNRVMVKDRIKQGVMMLILLVFTFLGRNLLPLLSSLVLNFGIFDEYSGYMNISVRYGFLLYFVYQLLNIVLANCIHKEFMDKDNVPTWNKKFDVININVQIIGLLFVVFTMIDINFGRYFRLLLIINSIDLSSLYYIRRKSCEKRDYRIKVSYSILVFITILVTWIIGESYVNHSFASILSEYFKMS